MVISSVRQRRHRPVVHLALQEEVAVAGRTVRGPDHPAGISLPRSLERLAQKEFAMISSREHAKGVTIAHSFTRRGLCPQTQEEDQCIGKHARKGFTWTSIAVNRDAKSLLHADSRTLRGSDNFAISFGDFTGGFLWLEGSEGQGPRTQTKANGTVVSGGSHDTRNSLCTSPRTCTTV